MAEYSGPAKPTLALNPREDSQFEKDLTQIQRRAKKKKEEKLNSGVVYLGHLPSTLSESHIYDYCAQFGDIRRFRLSRSKRTGNSRGFAFVEFESEDVAKIVAETMDNYLFGERLLSCKFMPREKVHKDLFNQCNVPFHPPSFPAVKRYNQKRGHLQMLKMEYRFKKKEKLLRKKLAKKGIDYSFPSLVLPKPKKEISSIANTHGDSEANQDPTPVCTPTFLERRKSQLMEINDDDEIILKLPVSPVKEDTQKTPAPESSGKKRLRKRKSKQ
ncbi:rCG37632 [Rattus norvegicus]|uniref:MKI67 FHA domain-interacting nucleolar phosphoprotein n=2 Tax=Rattus norvegicus TaxID=10116 RepID=MK67I_RAT|nr:MKI67 FHA domain-interacting nucleolar phosphoprotein [Rattus norvegicus]Q5RJM0.1 RecName: Full=MKI67 FHA domain-interacting nucleolar phosphoprotein; AltName: Full=Nucleolar protein interacting with the FHA domain of pKI-67 [Rattus norvegicus]AAH86585.1 Mki67ip protein [Rattus norvegicus]EDL87904.1 rCG37632 [Rattus norvegicus]|eukprot:NP_631925.2 MKI67 FHA domain-interacting nucleolar phosphoprotein [Rattus norvegicus]